MSCGKGNAGTESAPCSFAIGVKDLSKYVASAVGEHTGTDFKRVR
jgi:hypothetical protein